jgi:hypothetical protein
LWFCGRSEIESKSSRFRCLSPRRLVALNLSRYKASYPLFYIKLSPLPLQVILFVTYYCEDRTIFVLTAVRYLSVLELLLRRRAWAWAMELHRRTESSVVGRAAEVHSDGSGLVRWSNRCGTAAGRCGRARRHSGVVWTSLGPLPRWVP